MPQWRRDRRRESRAVAVSVIALGCRGQRARGFENECAVEIGCSGKQNFKKKYPKTLFYIFGDWSTNLFTPDWSPVPAQWRGLRARRGKKAQVVLKVAKRNWAGVTCMAAASDKKKQEKKDPWTGREAASGRTAQG